MEITDEEDTLIYIYFSKKRIDEYICNKEYKLAFQHFILVMERLDDHSKNDFIDYYTKKIVDFL